MNAACASHWVPFKAQPYNFKRIFMIKVNWRTVAKVLKFLGTVITSIAGTIAVQSCGPHLF